MITHTRSRTTSRALTLLALAGMAVASGCGNSTETTPEAGQSTSQSAEQAPRQVTDQSTGGATTPGSQPTTSETSTGQPPQGVDAGQASSSEEPQVAETGAGDEDPGQPGATTSSPFTELGITEVVVGDGEAVQPGATVTIHYRGTLRETGEQFDASYDRGQPATFSIMPGAVIDGFREGLMGMRVGGKRLVQIPWSMAYGEAGRPPVIPQRADLVFEIELLSVDNPEPAKKPELASEFEGEPMDMGDGLVVRDITVGSGQGEVKPGATVIAHYRGVLAETGAQFDSSYDRGQPATFRLDPGALIEGFSQGLMGMKAGGSRRIEIPERHAYKTLDQRTKTCLDGGVARSGAGVAGATGAVPITAG